MRPLATRSHRAPGYPQVETTEHGLWTDLRVRPVIGHVVEVREGPGIRTCKRTGHTPDASPIHLRLRLALSSIIAALSQVDQVDAVRVSAIPHTDCPR